MKKFDNTDQWIKEMTNYIIDSFWDILKYINKNDDNISAIFLAWAPGSGKSEFLETILHDLKENFIILDIDKYRNMFKWYNGENSSEYQNCSVKVADKILRFCFKNNLNFIFDGTFKSYGKVEQNLSQCEKFNRKILIILIFQEPRISFYYTFLRKLEKKRNVPVEVFVDGFYNSILNIFQALKVFKNINIIIAEKKYKDIDGHKFKYSLHVNFKEITKFCRYFRLWYDKWVFINRQKLKIDIEDFQNILTEQFSWNGTVMWKIKIWFFKKRFNW